MHGKVVVARPRGTRVVLGPVMGDESTDEL